MRGHHRTWPTALLTAVLLSASPQLSSARQVDAVLTRAAAAAAADRARPLLAEETYVQTLETAKALGGSNFGIGGAGMPAMEQHTSRAKRTVVSAWLATTRPERPTAWATVREPREVDGTPADGAARLQALAAAPDQLGEAWPELVRGAEAQHLGPLARDVVNPWLAVDLLADDRRSRLTFKLDGDERLQGTATTKLSFVERPGPSAIDDREGAWARVRGMLWIDAEGRTRRSRLDLTDASGLRRSRLEVEFAFDQALGTVVPVSVRERLDFPDGKLDAQATYRHHRRP